MAAKERGSNRRALGRGLDALLSPTAEVGVREIPLAQIEPNPDQPRQRFDRTALEELAASIREHGVVQPVVVSRLADHRYRLIIGERRWRAAQLAGITQLPAVVREATEAATLELALVENLQRADLNPLEEAEAYGRLMQEFGLTQQQVADRVGRSRAAVANTVRLLSLPETLKRAVTEDRITEGHARAILGLRERQQQMAVLERVEREGLTVRQTEELVRRLNEPVPSRIEPAQDPGVAGIEDDLRRALGTKVSLRPGRRGGRIVIEYYSDDEFQSLYDRLRGV
jgi:ParB family transcriptional regulator, chromosome partitioning protein